MFSSYLKRGRNLWEKKKETLKKERKQPLRKRGRKLWKKEEGNSGIKEGKKLWNETLRKHWKKTQEENFEKKRE